MTGYGYAHHKACCFQGAGMPTIAVFNRNRPILPPPRLASERGGKGAGIFLNSRFSQSAG